MSFTCDQQTISDLNLLQGDKNGSSIFDLFSKTKTIGGRLRLKEMIQTPSNDLHMLKRRVDAIGFFQETKFEFLITNRVMDFISHYLESEYIILKNNSIDIAIQKLLNFIAQREDYYIISSGVKNILYSLKALESLANEIRKTQPHSPYIRELSDKVLAFISKHKLNTFLSNIDLTKRENEAKIEWRKIVLLDNLFREVALTELQSIFKVIYEFDVLMCVASIGQERNFALPFYNTDSKVSVDLEGFFHPLIKAPIPNDYSIREKNVCFLTGSNMSGKSTFLKSISLCVYLAHVGFPVPAARMRTSIFNGLMTTINLSDSILSGYSHFMHEIARVKQAAIRIKGTRKYFIVFDELFRGTNSKDANDASTLIMNAFSKIEDSCIIISSHLVEIAKDLKTHNIRFNYIKTEISNSKPHFIYKVEEGVSKDRLGMLILHDEGVVDVLKKM